MNGLPPELEGFAVLLDAQPSNVRSIFQYCLCLMMVEAGKMRLIESVPGETSAISVFETTAGDTFGVARSPVSREAESEIIAVLREIINDEGLL